MKINTNIFEKLTIIKKVTSKKFDIQLNHTCGFSFATPKPVSLDTAKPLRTHDVMVSGDVLFTCACPDELRKVKMFWG